MRISVSGLSKKDSIFGSDKYLKLNHDKKKNKYSIEVKDHLTTADKLSRFLSNIFGTEYRNISKVLNSHEGQERLKSLGNKEVRAHLAEINQKIEKLNRKILVRKIPLINIPEATSRSPEKTPVPEKPVVNKPFPKPPKKPNELLLDFYTTDSGRDIENRTLNDILAFSHKKKEAAHNYIQWLFPLNEPSQFNPRAPTLTPALIDELLSKPEMKPNLQKSLNSMLDFYGLEWYDSRTEIKMSDSFDERSKVWLTKNNHNHLRITRILKCLQYFELEAESKAFFNCLVEIKAKHPNKITDATWKFWEKTQS